MLKIIVAVIVILLSSYLLYFRLKEIRKDMKDGFISEIFSIAFCFPFTLLILSIIFLIIGIRWLFYLLFGI